MSALEKHVHEFDMNCWRCDAETLCSCGECSRCGVPLPSAEEQRAKDDADRERRQRRFNRRKNGKG